MNLKRKRLFGSFTRKILWYINLLLAVFMLLAYLAVHVSPDAFWPLAFFGLAFPYILFINVAFVIMWLVRRRWYFLISLVVVVVGWGHIGHFIQIPLGENKKYLPDEPTFTLMTYNVRMFDFYRWSKEKGSANKMLEFFYEEQPDILCLQEFYIPKDDAEISLDFIKNSLQWMKYHHIDYINNFMGGKYGVATFSKFPIIRKGSQTFENSVNRVIFTDVLIGNDTIRIFNNHLQSYRLANNNFKFINNIKLENTDDQLREAKDLSKKLRNAFITRSKQVDKVAELIENSPYKVLVCGDFNDTPVSYTYKHMRGNLKDSFVTSGKGVSNTFLGRTPRFRIDYIFYSPELASSGYNKHNVKYSDHYPISAIIHLDN
jgi:endonuclease/exonuclease/phosphatase family metal-dependent hydrolase